MAPEGGSRTGDMCELYTRKTFSFRAAGRRKSGPVFSRRDGSSSEVRNRSPLSWRPKNVIIKVFKYGHQLERKILKRVSVSVGHCICNTAQWLLGERTASSSESLVVFSMAWPREARRGVKRRRSPLFSVHYQWWCWGAQSRTPSVY